MCVCVVVFEVCERVSYFCTFIPDLPMILILRNIIAQTLTELPNR